MSKYGVHSMALIYVPPVLYSSCLPILSLTLTHSLALAFA